LVLVFTIYLAFSIFSFANAELEQKVADIVHKVQKDAGVPSVSIAIVKDGRIVLTRAYGKARLQPDFPARSEMRYKIGSISKQFAATAILFLAEEGKLSLSDPVGKYIPDLTRGNDVTIRQILSHTSGYRDYWPQDYVPPFMKQTVTAESILTRWARAPLDFEPGSQYQYSNTGYVMAGVIVEKVSGKPLFDFLKQKIFTPLGMRSVLNADQENLTSGDPVGYTRFGLGPHRIAPKEGKGWLFATGGLAMTAEDLARWNIAMIEQKLLKPASYREMQTDVLLTNGVGTRYGLGVGVNTEQDHRLIQHGGAVSGFTALNSIFPDDRGAIVVLTNFDGAFSGDTISRQIMALLFASDQQVDGAREKLARKLFADLQAGKANHSLLTANAKSYFTEEALHDFAASLAPLGSPQTFSLTSQRKRGGMKLRIYNVEFPNKKLMILMRELPDGKVEQFQVFAAQ
jgi:D-alanyl-D-alanine carboxypeptidase